ncbi:MAG: hypothetical protein ACW972_12580 [Promethearchaeota archaeon]|jgi:hypothetical protein
MNNNDGLNFDKTYSDLQVDFAKSISSNYVEDWSSIIHGDNTINLTRKIFFDNMDNFLMAWDKVRVLKGSSANLKDQVITIKKFYPLSVYLNAQNIKQEVAVMQTAQQPRSSDESE